MSRFDHRLDRLYPALTARERGILVLQACKAGREEDPEIVGTMPAEQFEEYNHYISLMQGVNVDLERYVPLLEQLVIQLELRLACLEALHLWGMYSSSVEDYLDSCTTEPVTESEYQQRAEKARARMVPASKLAELLLERSDGELDQEAEPNEGHAEGSEVSRGGRRRLLAQKAAEIARLVQQGVLVGELKGRRLLVNSGSFYDWLGEPTPVPPNWGRVCEVFPDGKAGWVRCLQDEYYRSRKDIDQAPLRLATELPLRLGSPAREGAESALSRTDEIAETLVTSLRDGIQVHWQELRAFEEVIEEATAEFDGEDAADPRLRQPLEQTRAKLQELYGNVQRYSGSFELPEPTEELLSDVRRVVGRRGRH